MQLEEFLSTKTLDDVLGPAPKALVSISTEHSIVDTYAQLNKNGVNAVAVYNSDANNYCSWISRFDLLAYALQCDVFTGDFAKISKFFNSRVKQVTTLQNPFKVFDHKATLMQALNGFTVLKAKKFLVKRGEEFFAFTEIDFLAFLFTAMEEIPSFVQSSVKGLFDFLQRNGKENFECINSHQSALLAFEKMIAHKRSALGIVDDHHAMVGHISCSDFAGTEHSINACHKEVLAFLKDTNKVCAVQVKEAWAIHPQFTIGEALGKMLYYAIHQLWWLDAETMKPLLMVRADDFIQFISTLIK